MVSVGDNRGLFSQNDAIYTLPGSLGNMMIDEMDFARSDHPSSSPGSTALSPASTFSSLSRQESLQSSASSITSTPSSLFDEIKYEVMVNYLFQRQCSAMWVADGSGKLEGVMLRKSRGQYLSCPPQLAETNFGTACAMLNVQVCNFHIV